MIEGLHHVTAICSDAQRNVDFYTGVLGLRLVKRTVNFDDPGSYHLYYGDASGSPGTILTFFAWPGAYAGRVGGGEALSVALSVPRGSFEFWRERAKENGLDWDEGLAWNKEHETGPMFLRISDPDGMNVELHEGDDERSTEVYGSIPPEYAIRGLHSVALDSLAPEHTDKLFSELMKAEGESDGWSAPTVWLAYYYLNDGKPGARCSVQAQVEVGTDYIRPIARRGQLGAGSIHHVAWRVKDDAEQQQWRETLLREGFNVSPVMDRTYFRSIYFREPGGVLFEIATDSPGFTVDEPLESLGQSLKLPRWLEPQRTIIEAKLPPLRLPEVF